MCYYNDKMIIKVCHGIYYVSGSQKIYNVSHYGKCLPHYISIFRPLFVAYQIISFSSEAFSKFHAGGTAITIIPLLRETLECTCSYRRTVFCFNFLSNFRYYNIESDLLLLDVVKPTNSEFFLLPGLARLCATKMGIATNLWDSMARQLCLRKQECYTHFQPGFHIP